MFTADLPVSKNRVAKHPARNVIATLTTPQPKEKRYG